MWQWRNAAYAGVSRREWLGRFTAKELAEFEAAGRVEYLGADRLDYLACCIIATVRNQWAEEPIKPEQLMGLCYRENPEQAEADRLAVQAERLKHFAMLRNAQLEIQNGNRNEH